MFWPGKGFLNQSRNWAVESTWSSCLPLGKDGHLVEVFGEPGCILRDIDKPVFDHRGLRVHPGRRRPLRDRKFAESALEGDGFEPSVPRQIRSRFESSPVSHDGLTVSRPGTEG